MLYRVELLLLPWQQEALSYNFWYLLFTAWSATQHPPEERSYRGGEYTEHRTIDCTVAFWAALAGQETRKAVVVVVEEEDQKELEEEAAE